MDTWLANFAAAVDKAREKALAAAALQPVTVTE
jgi:hypothetical protein